VSARIPGPVVARGPVVAVVRDRVQSPPHAPAIADDRVSDLALAFWPPPRVKGPIRTRHPRRRIFSSRGEHHNVVVGRELQLVLRTLEALFGERLRPRANPILICAARFSREP
jgi:hypothetical protein